MKKQKLFLNKATIANLDNHQMEHLIGGWKTNIPEECNSKSPGCNTYPIHHCEPPEPSTPQIPSCPS